ncbi:MAG: hypothetical protein HY331_14435 [Chloroflexi bacterium]|nr:hypothetical protein [Chloroflexota bacterium]
MADGKQPAPLTRRRFLGSLALATGAASALPILQACAPAAPITPTAAPAVAPKPTSAPQAAPTAAPTVPRPVAPTAAAVPTQPAATAQPVSKIKRGGTFRAFEHFAHPTLDPQLSSIANNPSFSLLYDSLTQLYQDEKTGQWIVRPMLAESWETPDDTTMVLKLRKGVKFHDGSDFTAGVAKWNLDRIKSHPKSVGKDAVEAIQSVEVVDPSTLRLTLKAPSPSLPFMLSSGGGLGRTRIVSQAAVEKLGDEEFGRNPSGTGPMRLVEWVKDDRLVLKKSEGHWEKGEDGQPLPYVDGAVLRLQADMTIGAKELRAGASDISQLLVQDSGAIKADSNLVLITPPTMNSFYVLGLNARKGPFADNPKLRQAVGYAIDRESMVKALGLGFGSPAYYWWAPGQIGYDASIPRYDYQPEKAKQLVKEAGYPNGLDVRILTFPTPERVRNSQVVKQMLDAVGIRVTLDQAERLAWVAKTEAADFEIALWNRGYAPDPDVLSRDLVSTGAGNFSLWKNPEMDACMKDGRSTYDTAKRNDIYKRCQNIAFNDAHVILTWNDPKNLGLQKYVRGLRSNWAQWDARYVWLDR